MIASPEPPQGSPELLDVLTEFGDWLLDLVQLDGIKTRVGYTNWHGTPIDLWVRSRKLSWEWADGHPLIREYRRLIEAVHNDPMSPIPAFEALAILSLLKTLVRYRFV